MIARMTAKPAPGIRREVDKDPNLMNEEERAVFQCLEAEEFEDEAGYGELEDDFLLLANEGQPALVEVDDKNTAAEEDKVEEFENKGVVIFRDEEAEQLKAMREELRKRFGGLIGGSKAEE